MPPIGVSLTAPEFPDPLAIVDLAADLDRQGIDAIFVSESQNDVLTLLTAIALRTERARIGSAIALTYIRHPYSMALAAATVDRFANGRLVLGIGTGHQATTVDRLGISPGRPLSRLRDYLAALRAAFDDNPIAHRSDHFQITGSGLIWPPRRRLPIVIGALSDGMVRLAATSGDGIITSLATRTQILRFRRIMTESAEAAGRDPADLTLYATIRCCVRDSREEARDLAKRGLGYSAMPFYQRAFAREGLPASAGVVDDTTLDAIAIAGTPEDLQESIAALRDGGVDVPLLGVVSTEPDRAEAYRQLAALSLG